MQIEEKIAAFSELGRYLRHLKEDEFQSLAERVRNENPWYTEQNVRMAFQGVTAFLHRENLIQWTSAYRQTKLSRKVAIVMAGNIPLVGFHDLLVVLISGHHAVIKLSSKDTMLMKFVADALVSLEPRFDQRISFADQLKGFDIVIATGSDNSSRYFEYYFSKYPHVIRKNRTSVAILDGNETQEDMQSLGSDIFSYFGLGCRNVSKIFVPAGYTFNHLLENWENFNPIIHHHKYCNNYDYQKSILLVNRIPFLDNGFVLLQENERMVSPISVLYYEFYKDQQDLQQKIASQEDKIQCIVGKKVPATIPFGKAQYPSLTDYADQVDTMKFLSAL